VLSAAKRWALAPSAILTRFNLEDTSLLGGMVPGEEATTESRETLVDWEVTSVADARRELAHLIDTGLRAELDAIRAGTQRGTKPQQRFIAKRAAALGDRSLIAFDLARVSLVAGMAFHAGFIDEPEAWTACLTAARRLQRALPDWETFGRDYLLGWHFWQGEADRSLHHVYRALVLERDGPWSLDWNTPLDRP
jgi:hypothetical protein